MLTPQELAYFKQRLEAEKERVLGDIKELETPPDFGNEPGMEDEMSESEEALDDKAVSNSYRRHIADVDAALLRIEKGTYGICEKTGKEIPKEVLEVNPSARFHPDYLKSER
jgi:DnaK suppressor protein